MLQVFASCASFAGFFVYFMLQKKSVITFEDVLDTSACKSTSNTRGVHIFYWLDGANYYEMDPPEQWPMICTLSYDFMWSNKTSCAAKFDLSGGTEILDGEVVGGYRSVTGSLKSAIVSGSTPAYYLEVNFVNLPTKELSIRCETDEKKLPPTRIFNAFMPHFMSGKAVSLRQSTATTFTPTFDDPDSSIKITEEHSVEMLLQGNSPPSGWTAPDLTADNVPSLPLEDAQMLNFSSVCDEIVPTKPYQCVRLVQNNTLTSLTLAFTVSGTVWMFSYIIGKLVWKIYISLKMRGRGIAPEESAPGKQIEEVPPIIKTAVTEQ